jgi:hypothetical protein
MIGSIFLSQPMKASKKYFNCKISIVLPLSLKTRKKEYFHSQIVSRIFRERIIIQVHFRLKISVLIGFYSPKVLYNVYTFTPSEQVNYLFMDNIKPKWTRTLQVECCMLIILSFCKICLYIEENKIFKTSSNECLRSI